MTMFKGHVTKQLSAYCNGELAGNQMESVRAHLRVCSRCQKEYEEIKFGVNLASQLPLATAPQELWSEIEAILDQRSRRPIVEQKNPKFGFTFSWYRVAAVAAVLLIVVTIGLFVFRQSPNPAPRASLAVDGTGAVKIDGDRIDNKARLAIGETLETGDSSTAKVTVSVIGEVDLAPNSKLRLLQTKEDEHRLALDHGRMKATISAPPRIFFVNTPAAEAIDLGCVYDLEVDDAGGTLLHVTLGFVELVRNGRNVYVPRYAMCKARPGIGPGTPYFEDANQAFVNALERFDFEKGGENALDEVLRNSRTRDTFSLWHLLSEVDGALRVRVLNRMIELVGLPKDTNRELVLSLDQPTLEAWKDEMVDTVWY
ncbi:MAG TPA: zf-HC2 domain-containing protein [Blastocatellia bacterium]|nr:zf-HC2 domain-containing protein [Blastocatellia bacterium]